MCKKSGFLIQRAYQRTVPVPSQKRRIVPTYRTRTITKKTYRTSVPYFLAKIEAYCTASTYRTVLPSLLNRLTDIFAVGKFDCGVMVRYQSLTRKPELFRALWARAPLGPGPGTMYPLNPPLAGPGYMMFQKSIFSWGVVLEDVLGLKDTFSSPWSWSQPRSSNPWPWPRSQLYKSSKMSCSRL